MKRTEWLQETRMLRFEEAPEAWTESRLTQEEAARLLYREALTKSFPSAAHGCAANFYGASH